MLLTPTELERLTLFTAAELARKRRGKGLLLNHPEATAIIARAEYPKSAIPIVSQFNPASSEHWSVTSVPRIVSFEAT